MGVSGMLRDCIQTKTAFISKKKAIPKSRADIIPTAPASMALFLGGSGFSGTKALSMSCMSCVMKCCNLIRGIFTLDMTNR